MDVVQLKINGVIYKDDTRSVIDVRVERALSATGVCDITFAASRTGASTDAMLPASLAIGTEVEIAGGPGDNALVVFFKGEVTAISYEVGSQTGEYAVVRVSDKSNRLFHSQNKAVFEKVKVSDVITKLAGPASLTSDVVDTAIVHDYLLQTGSAGDFVGELCRRNGLYWLVENAKLIVRKGTAAPPKTVEISYDTSLLRISGRTTTSVAASKVAVRSWDSKRVQEVVGNGKPGTSIHTSPLVDKAKKISMFSPSTSSFASVAADSQVEAETIATAREDRARASQVQVRVECALSTHLADLKPGNAMKVTKVGAELDGTYLIASAVHVWSSGRWRSTLTTGTIDPPTFAELTGAGDADPRWDAPAAVIGVVTNVGDDADHKEHVRVRFPTAAGTAPNGTASAWARVVSPGAGRERGLLAMPHVNDEVVVVFEQGDFRRPLVLGGLWNGNSLPPAPRNTYAPNGETKIWQLTSALGRTLVIDDKDKHVSILCKETDLKLRLGEDKVELWAKQGTPLEIKQGDASILFDKDGNVTLKGKKVTIEASDDLTVKGNGITIEAQAALEASGKTAKVSSTSGGTVEANANVKLTGSKVQINS